MALVEVELKTHRFLGGIGSWGDISVRNHPTVHFVYNILDPKIWIGNATKAIDPEFTIFLRYKLEDIPNLPSGATFTRGKFKITSSNTPVTDGPLGYVRIGHLEHDGRWNDGFNNSGWDTPHYPAGQSYNYPFPTLPQSDAVIAGRLVDDQFMGQWDYDINWAIGETKIIGDAPYSPEYDLDYWSNTPVADAINADRITYGSAVKYIAFTMDGYQLPVGAIESVPIAARDFAGTTFEGVVLFLEYDENPPIITNTPLTDGGVSVPYSAAMTATDPTNQDVTFAFLQQPAGSIGFSNGLFFWNPTVGQVGANIIEVEATDEDGFTDTLLWVVTVVETPPIITNVPPTDGEVGTLYSEQMTATDPSDQDVTFAFLQNPAGATMVDGLISWTPTAGQVGPNTFEVEAEDEDGYTDTLLWVVTVTSPASALSGDVQAITILEGEVEAMTVLNASSIQATPVLDSESIAIPTVLEGSVEATPVLGATEITSTPILEATRIEIVPLE